MEASDKAGGLAARAEARIRTSAALMSQNRLDEAIRVIHSTNELGKVDRLTEARMSLSLAHAETARGGGPHAITSRPQRSPSRPRGTAKGSSRHPQPWPVFIASRDDRPRLRGASRACSGMNRGDKRTEVRALHGLVEARSVSGRLEGIDPMVQKLREAAIADGRYSPNGEGDVRGGPGPAHPPGLRRGRASVPHRTRAP